MSAKHQVMDQFTSVDNQLMVANYSLAQIETLVGQTPFYAYDSSVITNSVTSLRNQLPAKISVHFAIKANPYPPLVAFMKDKVNGFDVASKKEMLLALQAGMPAKQISFAGPGKSDKDLSAAIVAGVTLHAESNNEIKRILELSQNLAVRANLAIRVNPTFELKASGMKMSGGAKPFGIDEEQVFELLNTLPFELFNFKGFHIFAGSQNLNVDALVDMHNQTFALANKLVCACPVPIEYINLGGGFGVPYFPGEKRLSIDPIAQNLRSLCQQYVKLKDIELILELGRYLVAEAGIYVCKVVDLKDSRGKKYIVADGGLHHHLANSGNFGQVIRKNYPVAIGNKLAPSSDFPTETVEIVGPLCTPLDILANKVELPKAQVGDYIVVYQSGAYGCSASPKDFLSQPEVSEIFI